ncbi:ABZJ_00895 family protein [Vannielia litorea]|uniref:Uncharacterized protein n=1 Tax=Vannielia litorea TaxID=1217970 RepID=A0A1N6IM56_9RHOB|nr:ABZJ_00895 family protein [Vannielia litorea]SIO33086.1 hypothetical protein SAMN05444002_4063 [Vannielia litorea]
MQISYLRYTGVYVATMLALAALNWALATFASYSLPSGLGTILPPMLAAMLEGQFHARATRAPLAPGEAWRAAGVMTGIAAVIAGLMLVIVAAGTPEYAQLPTGLLAGITLALLVATFLVNRLFLGMGARQELRAQARRP